MPTPSANSSTAPSACGTATTTWRPATPTGGPATGAGSNKPPATPLVEGDDAPDVAPGVHVGVALVDLVEGVGPGHELGALELAGLDADDPGGAGGAGALHGVDADPADAHDDRHVTGLDLGAVDGRPPAGGDAAADEAGDVEGNVLGDLHAADRGHDGILREGRHEGHLGDFDGCFGGGW